MAQIIVLQHDTAVRANIITVRTNARTIDSIGKAILIEQLKKSCTADRLQSLPISKTMARFVSLLELPILIL